MTQGGSPAEPFATHEDVVSRWRPFRDNTEKEVAVERLADASAHLRLTLLRLGVNDFAARVQSDPDVARVAKSLVVEVVRRYLRNPDGAKQLQKTIGPRSYGLTYDGEKPSGIFFTDDELQVLLQPGDGKPSGVVFGTMTIGLRPGSGWAPPAARGGWPTG